ncbi:hypothetical protein F4808DRAFT_441131 [Astrocystis sublimbata]|nr:hypothetical protein F4808DRAFT_441131 [Astrocystis sublimbata]
MFEIPEAKRVRRKDLDDSASASGSSSGTEEEREGCAGARPSPEAEQALRAKLNAQLSGLLDFSFKIAPQPPQEQQQKGDSAKKPQDSDVPMDDGNGEEQPEDGNPDGEEAFAFRLFLDEALTHTVVLTNEDEPGALGEGAFVTARPREYYIAALPSPAQLAEYRSVAVSAEYVLADAKRRRWGLEKPWRVIHIGASSNSGPSGAIRESGGEKSGGETKKKSTRPGKKHRIVLRVKEKAAKERAEAAKKKLVEKEQHLQDKKKRLNRERKLKRRQKEREKKAATQGTGPDGDVGDDSKMSLSDDE